MDQLNRWIFDHWQYWPYALLVAVAVGFTGPIWTATAWGFLRRKPRGCQRGVTLPEFLVVLVVLLAIAVSVVSVHFIVKYW
jgi:prepilin-type N-terminal cleavage/methylation domain-containing protein